MILGAGLWAASALAQVQSATPPVFSAIDERGVDRITGKFRTQSSEVSIGVPGSGGLSHSRSWIGAGWRDDLAGTVKNVGAVYTVSIGGASETFTYASGVFTSNQAVGSTLTFNSGNNEYSYTTANGTLVILDKDLADTGSVTNFWSSNEGLVTSLTKLDGEVLTWTYVSATAGGVTGRRPQSVSNNLGYQIHFTYANDAPANSGQVTGDFLTRTEAVGINRAFYYCADNANTCNHSSVKDWPYVTYGTEASGTIQTVTDRMGSVARYVFSGADLVGLRKPTSPSYNTFGITYASGKVQNIDAFGIGGSYWSYAFADSSGIRTSTATQLLGASRVTKSDISAGWMTEEWADASGVRKTVYTRDGSGRVTRVTGPDGEYTNLTYDSRGNITQTTVAAKLGTSLPSITTYASYPCSNAKACNSPATTTDARGFVTSYAYNTTHGALETVTSPGPSGSAPNGSGAPPQTRYSYTPSPIYAWFKNSGSPYVQAASGVYRLAAVSSCATGTVATSCVGTSDETRTEFTYLTGSSSVASNLQVEQQKARSGNTSGAGAVEAISAFTYTAFGDLATVDGPLKIADGLSADADDTTRFYYDDARRPVATVSADPDGGGSLAHRVVKTTYNTDGQTTRVEQGYVSTPSSWSSATIIRQLDTAYNYLGLPIQHSLAAGGTTFSVQQMSYDDGLRPMCAATRMNPSEFSTLTADACALDTAGSYGADRVTQFTMDNYSQLTAGFEAYGTAHQRLTRSAVVAASSGTTTSETDANGNKTSYTYDDFNRRTRTTYPSASTPGSSNSADYEELTYDAYGFVTARRTRDGQVFYYAYDSLGRVFYENTPGTDIVYIYDNFGSVTTICYWTGSACGQSVVRAYDSLGRLKSETQSGGTVSYQYDAGGRRTRMTWPDAVYVTYLYDVVGELTQIKESGSSTLATLAYDNAGQRTSLTRGNSSLTGYAYDGAGRLTDLAHNITTNTAYNNWTDLDYNPAGQIVGRTLANTTYDFTLPSGYTDTYAANGLNRYTSAGGVTPTYTDGRGNMTYDGAKTYGYDHYNRMTSAGAATLAYDPMSRLYEVAGAATTRFLYDGVDVISEYNTSGTVQRRYVHGPGLDEPLVWYEGANLSDKRYIYADERGSTVAVESSSSVTKNTYDEYGVPGSSNVGRFQYTGQMWLSDVGLYHYKARAYSPELGRFMQADPIGYGDGMNFYSYVGNDPVNLVDPFGLMGVEKAECDYSVGNPVGSIGIDRVVVCGQPDSLGGSGMAGGGGGESGAGGLMGGVLMGASGPVSTPPNARVVVTGRLAKPRGWGIFRAGVLPNDPSGLGPEWQQTQNQNPNGSEWYNAQEDVTVEFHKAQQGKGGWKGKDHWHVGKGRVAAGRHIRPGTNVPLFPGISPVPPVAMPWFFFWVTPPLSMFECPSWRDNSSIKKCMET